MNRCQGLFQYVVFWTLILTVVSTGWPIYPMVTEEKDGVSITLIEYSKDETVDLFDAQVWVFSNTYTYMITPSYFTQKNICPVGIIVHNKGFRPVKISRKSVSDPMDLKELLERSLADFTVGGWSYALWGCFVFAIAMGNAYDRAKQPVYSFPLSLLGPYPLTVIATSSLPVLDWMVWRNVYTYRNQLFKTIATHILDQERVIMPGQKIITYTLRDRYDHGVDRFESGILSGMNFSLFTLDDQVYTTVTVEEYNRDL